MFAIDGAYAIWDIPFLFENIFDFFFNPSGVMKTLSKLSPNKHCYNCFVNFINNIRNGFSLDQKLVSPVTRNLKVNESRCLGHIVFLITASVLETIRAILSVSSINCTKLIHLCETTEPLFILQK